MTTMMMGDEAGIGAAMLAQVIVDRAKGKANDVNAELLGNEEGIPGKIAVLEGVLDAFGDAIVAAHAMNGHGSGLSPLTVRAHLGEAYASILAARRSIIRARASAEMGVMT